MHHRGGEIALSIEMEPCQEGDDLVKHRKDDTQCKGGVKYLCKIAKESDPRQLVNDQGCHGKQQHRQPQTPKPDGRISKWSLTLT